VGLVRYHVLFVIDLASRRVEIAGISRRPDGDWMGQMARNPLDAGDGFLLGKRYPIIDRDPLYTSEFRAAMKRGGVEVIRLPPSSPNLNAFAERFVLSIRSECLDRIVRTRGGAPAAIDFRVRAPLSVRTEPSRAREPADRGCAESGEHERPGRKARGTPQLLTPASGVNRVDASLAHDGIGTPATQANIIETLFERGFVEKRGRQIISTPTARTLIAIVPSVATRPDMTGLWESAMRRIADSQLPLKKPYGFAAWIGDTKEDHVCGHKEQVKDGHLLIFVVA
jgi:hypothetical protein